MTKEPWDSSYVDEQFTYRSFRYIFALLTHTGNTFLSSRNVSPVSCIDLVSVTRVVLHVGGMQGKHLGTPVILVMVLSVTCS